MAVPITRHFLAVTRSSERASACALDMRRYALDACYITLRLDLFAVVVNSPTHRKRIDGEWYPVPRLFCKFARDAMRECLSKHGLEAWESDK